MGSFNATPGEAFKKGKRMRQSGPFVLLKQLLKLLLRLLLILFVGILSGCGTAKDPNGAVGSHPFPEFQPRQKASEEKGTFILKSEELQLTGSNQPPQWNLFQQIDAADSFLKLRKRFIFPIQHRGWVAVDAVNEDVQQCRTADSKETQLTLLDDHGGRTLLARGQKYPVILEKLYALQAEFENSGQCQHVDVQFVIFYGENE
jgi:hypothetical protein